MRYYLIVGEASGDLHASHLMSEIKKEDINAEFRFLGGDMMAKVGGTLVKHYREMAYMGFIPVMMHLHIILKNMKECKQDIVEWKPDVLILVDYPGFNLKIAEYIKNNTNIPIYYYIAPKIWAWKEYRIKNLKRDVSELFSILPFEVDFFEKKHQYPIHYVGNPTVDEVESFLSNDNTTIEDFRVQNGLNSKPIIAILAGSRKQEINDNLSKMIEAASSFKDYQLVVAGAPSIDPTFYNQYLKNNTCNIIFGQTYSLLKYANIALVTSGTATLETALFNTPQVVCYYMKFGKIVSLLRKLVLKVPYISLVNLIVGREVVKELVADGMTVNNIRKELNQLINHHSYHEAMLNGYKEMKDKLGSPGAPYNAAKAIISKLKK